MGTEAESVRSAMPMDLEKGVCYLVKEKKPELSYRLFETLVAAKNPGLCITRQYPERVRRVRGLSQGRANGLGAYPRAGFSKPPPTRAARDGVSHNVRGNTHAGGRVSSCA